MNRFKYPLWVVRDAAFLTFGMLYDTVRYALHSSTYVRKGDAKLNYMAVKAYHSIEKSLSMANRVPNAGWNNAKQFISLLVKHRKPGDSLSFHEEVGIGVIHKLATVTEAVDEEKARLLASIQPFGTPSSEGGVITNCELEIAKGKLSDPESFFLTRYSVRQFSREKVCKEIVERALVLAAKTPSVCNRESYFVYHMDDAPTIRRMLSYQNGNRGFSEEINCLLAITTDLRAFTSHIERYQHWIDGGMYAMSLVYAFHSLGLGTCCLNWSQSAIQDIRTRKAIPISKHHSIIMLVAVGHLPHQLTACSSSRSPTSNHYAHLSLAKDK